MIIVGIASKNQFANKLCFPCFLPIVKEGRALELNYFSNSIIQETFSLRKGIIVITG
jgi:hypothetical protein